MSLEWLKTTPSVSFADRSKAPYNILIVDDDEEVHQVTKLVLNDFEFEGHPMNFISVYSKSDAEGFFKTTELDIALILLDVVMETEDAGLLLVKQLRAFNHFTRIILRTGQPGLAPEHSVIKEFDIDAYKSKTELKQRDLESLFYTSLRSYRDLVLLQHQRRGLAYILNSVNELNHATSFQQLGSIVGNKLMDFFPLHSQEQEQKPIDCFIVSELNKKRSNMGLQCADQQVTVLPLNSRLPADLSELANTYFSKKENAVTENCHLYYLKTQRDNEIVLMLKMPKIKIKQEDENLLQLFCSNVMLVYENLYLNKDIRETQELIIRLLGGTMESRSKETGVHVIRVGEFSALLAELLGCPSHYVYTIRIAAPLHDVGKVGIPDSILNKPGKLTAEEWETMQKHAWEGYRILKDTGNPMVEMAARIARDHHEKFSGGGYPRSISDEEISLEGKIVALADVYDALTHRRCYKEAWELSEVYDILEKERGTHFAPEIVDVLLSHKDRFEEILRLYPDE